MTQNHQPDRESVFRIGVQRSLLVFVVAIVLSALLLIQFENFSNLSLAMTIVLLMGGLVFKRGWLIYLMFATIAFLRIDDSALGWGFDAILTWPDLFFTLTAMILAGLCIRYLELSKFLLAYYPSFRSPTSPTSSSINGSRQFPSLLGGRWYLIPASILFSVALLSIFPFDRVTARRLAITPEGTRLVFLAFFLFICWFSSSSIVSILARWNMNSDQADIQARSLIAKEFWNESYPLEQRRAKIRRRDGD